MLRSSNSQEIDDDDESLILERTKGRQGRETGSMEVRSHKIIRQDGKLIALSVNGLIK